MRMLDMHEIFESFCYAIGAYESLRHASFCIKVSKVRQRSMIQLAI